MGVGVIVVVEVAVGVSVGVDVLVGVNVRVGVRVSVAKNVLIGLLGPPSHAISRITPIKTSTPAIIIIIFGPRDCLRLRYELITLDDEEDEIGGLLFMSYSLFIRRFFEALSIKL